MSVKWYRITWRGFSGRLHVFPKAVKFTRGWWWRRDGSGLPPAIANHVVRKTLWKAAK